MDKNGRFLLFFLLAGIVGLINGLFGGGGGMLCVPIFKKMLALPDKKAHATTIAAISLISFPTLCIYLCTLDYSWQNIILVTIGTLFGGVVGGFRSSGSCVLHLADVFCRLGTAGPVAAGERMACGVPESCHLLWTHPRRVHRLRQVPPPETRGGGHRRADGVVWDLRHRQ